MLFKTAVVSFFALLCANQAAGAALEPRLALIATTAYAACNCPNNCSHKKGSSCKFYSGPTDDSGVLKGKCAKPNSYPGSDLECIPH
ncbi:hypothetical protein F5Y13DRAFT_190330 [Hypoxylon sp. FL1857]|nr:hypothetical protein F5Y13DRAFT_190330 [Hypoxylon sp. FL1857]